MPLENRVDPFGNIHAVEARGMFTGNRGVIHDPATRTLLARRWTTKAWIICSCHYKGKRREPMGCNGPDNSPGWTNLFFLDEVTALAAGHRPCFTCRRDRAKEFAALYGRAFGVETPLAPDIDVRLHGERPASRGRSPRLEKSDISALPDGAMLFQGGKALAKRGNALKTWTFGGWAGEYSRHGLDSDHIRLLTPATTLAILLEGYRPVWHASAGRA